MFRLGSRVIGLFLIGCVFSFGRNELFTISSLKLKR
jgi:hypothetical protein